MADTSEKKLPLVIIQQTVHRNFLKTLAEELDIERRDHFTRDFILQSKDILQVPILAPGPTHRIAMIVRKLHRHADTPPRALCHSPRTQRTGRYLITSAAVFTPS
jgi:hypothetical protein